MANGNNAANVGVAKPASDGCLYVAPANTKVPTDATSPLGPEWECVGYLSEDGFSEAVTRTSEDKKAFGGDVVATSQTEYGDGREGVPRDRRPPAVYGREHAGTVQPARGGGGSGWVACSGR